ncbi:phosphoadenosine phosphosulfate reductase domain-containing protein [Chitinophaga silvisoli]|uniref:FAD synthetase n=1 Tax=Chitinophaga silvisoli TaxID=2291814 RepID=A0A3E1P2Q3_9BACT|nr:phosphoadenosine phosphosulfate reductase family protein [Chitinophaga silvisoli]RFM34410.1 FAD synthetase [Chitinophaga silvisoli]
MSEINNIHYYDKYIVAFSGGKDSTACFLYLLDQGIPVSKIELWHHDIDGREKTLMDWEVTPAYCRAFAEAFHVPIYFSWKHGGFRREMLRKNALTAPVSFECLGGEVRTAGGKTGKPNTRLKFPQITPDLSLRWCSSYLKIDVGVKALVNQNRFNGKRTLFISGERGEESTAREKYNRWEEDKADCRYKGTYYKTVTREGSGITRNVQRTIIKGKKRRHVDRYRPVLSWSEAQVWKIIEKYGVRVHPCYYLGYSRCSCKFCIFGNADQFATSYAISPAEGNELIAYEKEFGVTMKRNITLSELIASGKPFNKMDARYIRISTSHSYNLSITMLQGEQWILPAGAFKGECAGR